MRSLIELVLANDLDGLKSAIACECELDERDADGRTALHHAVIDNNSAIVRLLLDSGADASSQDKLGNSALHYAAQEYSVEIAKVLVEYGANVDQEDRHGNTPLWRAVFDSRGRGEMIAMLLDAGADRNHTNKHGKTPFQLANTIANYDVKQFFDE